MKVEALQSQMQNKEDTIKKLKKKIVTSYIKEKIWTNRFEQ